MSSGHASHKGAAAKPNTNTNGVIGDASDNSVAPQDLLDNENGYPFDREEPENAAATERPSEPSK